MSDISYRGIIEEWNTVKKSIEGLGQNYKLKRWDTISTATR